MNEFLVIPFMVGFVKKVTEKTDKYTPTSQSSSVASCLLRFPAQTSRQWERNYTKMFNIVQKKVKAAQNNC